MVDTISLNNPAAFTNAEALGSGAKNPVDGSLIKGNFDKIIAALNALIIAYNASELEFTNNTKVFADFNSKVPEVFFRSPIPTYIPTGLVIPCTIDDPLTVVMRKQGTSLVKLFQTTSPLTITTGTNGANGIDAPLVNGAIYYCWLIGKEDGTMAGLLSQSNDAPTMPDSSYVYKFRLNWSAVTFAVTGTYLAHFSYRTDISTSGIPTAASPGVFVPWQVLTWNQYTNNIQFVDTGFGVGAVNFLNNYSTLAFSVGAGLLRTYQLTFRGYPSLWLVPPECNSFVLTAISDNTVQAFCYPERTDALGSYRPLSIPFVVDSVTSAGVTIPVTSNRAFQMIHNTTSTMSMWIKSYTLAHTNPYGV
jgi:hypothetical protein